MVVSSIEAKRNVETLPLFEVQAGKFNLFICQILVQEFLKFINFRFRFYVLEGKVVDSCN